MLLQINFEVEGQLYANCYFHILAFQNKYFLLSRSIHLDIAILTRVQKGHISGYKSPHNLLKNVLLKLYLQHEGHFYGNSLFCVLTIYLNVFYFSIQVMAYALRFPSYQEFRKDTFPAEKGVIIC